MKALIFLATTLACGVSVGLLAETEEAHGPAKIESDVLPNAYRLSDKVLSGGQPQGEAAFKELSELGVRTIISVDGATPDVELAKKYGLRYVHLPHGYDGIPGTRLVTLAKAVRELPGPIYIHCHHGKHRSPAAAASACIAAGILDNDEGLAVLEAAGTGKNYLGLFQSVREARPIDAKTLSEMNVEFPEIAQIPPLADAMIAIEHTHDHLKVVAAAGWKPTEKHADIDPPHEALLLRELFTELLRSNDLKKHPAEFREMVRHSEAAAQNLEDLLRRGESDPKKLNAQFARITADCTACHAKFRDTPLQQKAAATR